MSFWDFSGFVEIRQVHPQSVLVYNVVVGLRYCVDCREHVVVCVSEEAGLSRQPCLPGVGRHEPKDLRSYVVASVVPGRLYQVIEHLPPAQQRCQGRLVSCRLPIPEPVAALALYGHLSSSARITEAADANDDGAGYAHGYAQECRACGNPSSFNGCVHAGQATVLAGGRRPVMAKLRAAERAYSRRTGRQVNSVHRASRLRVTITPPRGRPGRKDDDHDEPYHQDPCGCRGAHHPSGVRRQWQQASRRAHALSQPGRYCQPGCYRDASSASDSGQL